MGTEITIALVVGVILSLLFAEKTGIVPAGLVVPGYLSLSMNDPIYIVATLFITFATYLIVMQGIAKVTIIYGRRKFTAMLLTGIIITLIFNVVFSNFQTGVTELLAIGLIVPGLIANTIQKQGVLVTVSSTMLLSITTFLVMTAYYLV